MVNISELGEHATIIVVSMSKTATNDTIKKKISCRNQKDVGMGVEATG